jgi:hypothetical protein
MFCSYAGRFKMLRKAFLRRIYARLGAHSSTGFSGACRFGIIGFNSLCINRIKLEILLFRMKSAAVFISICGVTCSWLPRGYYRIGG